jgi:thiamine biosynthesis lipoprotein
LSRFNQSANDDWLSASPDLLTVAKRALRLAEETNGAFDPTVAPLVRLWRLRQITPEWSPPSASALAKTKQFVGWQRIEFRDQPPSLRKLNVGIELDLNALVEGFAIDRIAALLQDRGVRNCLIELGGEFRGCGHKANGQAWCIGLEDPRAKGQLHSTLDLQDAAVSTSGNYRSAIEHEGRRYGHIFDARRGEPVQHDLIAVSVCANDALTADGWSTALLALGPVEGFALAEKKGLSASFVIGNARDGISSTARESHIRLTTKATSQFVPYAANR